MATLLKLSSLTGFATAMVKFDIAHFRAVGWFNAAVGVVLLLLQVAMFRGEWKMSHTATNNKGRSLIMRYVHNNQMKCKDFCKFIVSTTIDCNLQLLSMNASQIYMHV